MIVVYAQLSLRADEVRRILPEARVVPPIRRGDLIAHHREGARCFLIVDGEFHQSLAVSPNEVLDVMRAGGLVFGSSSMGALRAAELEPYGMIGFGRIYEHVRATPCFSDDDLGHLYDAESGRLLTLPRVEIDFILADARLSARLRRQHHYTRLDLPTLLEFIGRHASAGKRKAYLAALKRAFVDPSVRCKHEDALGLLRLAKAQLASVRVFNRGLATSLARVRRRTSPSGTRSGSGRS